MPEKRVKVRVEHHQKAFYERFLHVLRQQTEDKNQKFVIYKAYCSMRNYPLEVCSITDLKRIHGIGETLAVRCHSAWEAACEKYPSGIDLRAVKSLRDGNKTSSVSSVWARKREIMLIHSLMLRKRSLKDPLCDLKEAKV
ncbi:hypothetical protein COOONC_27910 [Cooperia oncophora]